MTCFLIHNQKLEPLATDMLALLPTLVHHMFFFYKRGGLLHKDEKFRKLYLVLYLAGILTLKIALKYLQDVPITIFTI